MTSVAPPASVPKGVRGWEGMGHEGCSLRGDAIVLLVEDGEGQLLYAVYALRIQGARTNTLDLEGPDPAQGWPWHQPNTPYKSSLTQ